MKGREERRGGMTEREEGRNREKKRYSIKERET